jgi:hypothetical protein
MRWKAPNKRKLLCTLVVAASNILKYKHLTKEIQRMWNTTTKVTTSYYRENWSHLRRIQKISEQHNIGEGHQGTTENSHTEHCTHT